MDINKYEKDVFYVCGHRKNVIGYRLSNRSIFIPINSIIDSDSLILEDCYGHRYTRTIDFDSFAKGYFVFEMI